MMMVAAEASLTDTELPETVTDPSSAMTRTRAA